MIVLKTPRLVLREFIETDFNAVHQYASDPEVVRYMSWGPNTRTETKRFIQRSIQNQLLNPRTNYELAIILENMLIGGCGITIKSTLDKSADIGYCLRSEEWGRGIGTEVAGALIKFGFKELKLHRMVAICDTENHASYRVMEKNDMHREGVLRENKSIHGKWRNSYVYSILAHEWKE
jgi:RimJ/RimL family protein N-acetyltransferase